MSHDLTLPQLQKALPKTLSHNATQVLVDKVNGLVTDPIIREAFRDNLLSFASVMKDGRFKIANYVDAVRYITHQTMSESNLQSYVKTFPDRYQNFLVNGTSEKDIASYVSMYNKNKLVNLVRDQSAIPTYILNADLYQSAINTQAALMMSDEVSPKVRSDAANSLLTHLKAPEATKIELDISVKEDSVIQDLRQTTMKLVAEQRRMLEAGMVNPKQVAEQAIVVEGEFQDVG